MGNEDQEQRVMLPAGELYKLIQNSVMTGKEAATYEQTHLYSGKGEEPWRALPMWGTLGQATDLYNKYLLDRSAPKPGFGDEVHNMFYSGRPAERLYDFTPKWCWMDAFYLLPVAWTAAEEFIMANKDKVADMKKGFADGKYGDALNQINIWENTGNWPKDEPGYKSFVNKAKKLKILGDYKGAIENLLEASERATDKKEKAKYWADAFRISKKISDENSELKILRENTEYQKQQMNMLQFRNDATSAQAGLYKAMYDGLRGGPPADDAMPPYFDADE
ncbi:MAG: hypothetical protein V1887_03830 [Candidatus Aenigmatarchaeota archaeon]